MCVNERDRGHSSLVYVSRCVVAFVHWTPLAPILSHRPSERQLQNSVHIAECVLVTHLNGLRTGIVHSCVVHLGCFVVRRNIDQIAHFRWTY